MVCSELQEGYRLVKCLLASSRIIVSHKAFGLDGFYRLFERSHELLY